MNTKSKILHREDRTGFLVLKSGTVDHVSWKVNIHDDGSFGEGEVRGKKKLLEAAAADGSARLEALDCSLAVAINDQTGCKASFTTLLAAPQPQVFSAHAIGESHAMGDGRQFGIEFIGKYGQTILIILPTTVLAEHISVLQSSIPRGATAPHEVQKVDVGYSDTEPLVSLFFDDGVPILLPIDMADWLVKKLTKVSKIIAERP